MKAIKQLTRAGRCGSGRDAANAAGAYRADAQPGVHLHAGRQQRRRHAPFKALPASCAQFMRPYALTARVGSISAVGCTNVTPSLMHLCPSDPCLVSWDVQKEGSVRGGCGAASRSSEAFRHQIARRGSRRQDSSGRWAEVIHGRTEIGTDDWAAEWFLWWQLQQWDSDHQESGAGGNSSRLRRRLCTNLRFARSTVADGPSGVQHSFDISSTATLPANGDRDIIALCHT